jgi:signal recognition particle GTPase
VLQEVGGGGVIVGIAKKNGKVEEEGMGSEIKDGEDDYCRLEQEKEFFETQSKKLIAEKLKLQKEIKELQENKTSKNKVTTDSLRELKDYIGTTALELNAQKEKNSRDEKALKELNELLSCLKQNVEYADTEFTTNCLDEFDRRFASETKNHFNATEIYKSITSLLKKTEKDYDFNAIDPIDEERDYMDLKQKLIQLEKHREQMGPITSREDFLTQSDKESIDKIEDIKDLNALKCLEDKI